MAERVVLEYAKSGEIGVVKTIKARGDGTRTKMADVCKVKYSVFLANGSVIQESAGTEVKLGMRQLYGTAGDLALLSMTTGERAFITCDREFSSAPGQEQVTIDLRLLEIVDKEAVAAREMRIMALIVFLFIAAVLTFHFTFHK